MTDRPIIFSAPMVRALLAGTKTQTRRVLKPQPEMFDIDGKACGVGLLHVEGEILPRVTTGRVITAQEVHFVVGDRLYVRENFAYVGSSDPGYLTYQATYPGDLAEHGMENIPATLKEAGYKWTPCIHMPRKLSRLTLLVTDVKIERLQDISRDDAIAEGATSRSNCNGFRQLGAGWSMDWSEVGKISRYATGGPGPLLEQDISHGDPRSAFGGFINLLHGGERWNCNGTVPLWDQNPFVVAVSFDVVKSNIDSLPAGPA